MSLRSNKLHLRAHKKYLLRFLDVSPGSLASNDMNRAMIAYFSISGLDVLKSLDSITNEKKNCLIDWLYLLQVVDNNDMVSGFQGSTTFNTLRDRGENGAYKWGHIAGTYCALTSLLILGDDLSRVDRRAVIESCLKLLQLPNGCFKAAKEGTESDMRFLFCAASICYILDDWSGMDLDKAVNFIKNSISYDFGIGQEPELEAHGGSAYCALATLALSNKLNCLSFKQKEGIKKWLLGRQEDGFQGRPNKQVDTCYSFWVGATLKILDAYDLVNHDENKLYVLSTQDNVIGGFSKWVDSTSDPLHTYLGLAGLSLMKEDDSLNEVNPILNITYRAHDHLKQIHMRWKGTS